METSILNSTQKYAAAGLFAIAFHESQIHQTRPSSSLLPLGKEPISEGLSIDSSVSVSGNPIGESDSSVSISDDHALWIRESSGLLFAVFRVIEVDNQAWHGLMETAGASSQVRHHVGAFLTLLSQENDGNSSARSDKELSLTKAVDAMVLSMETSLVEDTNQHSEYEIKCREKYSNAETRSTTDATAVSNESSQKTSPKSSTEETHKSCSRATEKTLEEGTLLSYERKVTVLYELISACVASTCEDDKKCSRLGKGYDARYRVALRLMTAWLGVKWIKMEALEIMVGCYSMDSVKGEGAKEEETNSSESPWDKWKRGGIIGAAALTGGTLMAVTGGLAAPAIAHGFGALAPTLGSGFAAAASATGSAAGSVAVATSFGAAGAGLSGNKMARRIGNIEEFEFKAIGKNHNQGRLAVGIFISGLVFEDQDFLGPWEGHNDNLERYGLWWESKNLIAVSTAIQDWLTSRIAIELTRQGAMMTVLSPLVAALSLPAALLQATNLIDNKWAIAMDRSDKAGMLLAEVLLKGLQGNRPVTLIGFSLGARVILKCLQSLAEAEEHYAAGLIERVVLLGAPISIKDEKWDIARKMVAGRFVNAYSTNDWTLGIAFRASLLSEGLAGIQPVDVPGIENVDVTHLIEGHSSYLWTTKQIIENLELDCYDPVFRIPCTEPQVEKSSVSQVDGRMLPESNKEQLERVEDKKEK